MERSEWPAQMCLIDTSACSSLGDEEEIIRLDLESLLFGSNNFSNNSNSSNNNLNINSNNSFNSSCELAASTLIDDFISSQDIFEPFDLQQQSTISYSSSSEPQPSSPSATYSYFSYLSPSSSSSSFASLSSAVTCQQQEHPQEQQQFYASPSLVVESEVEVEAASTSVLFDLNDLDTIKDVLDQFESFDAPASNQSSSSTLQSYDDSSSLSATCAYSPSPLSPQAAPTPLSMSSTSSSRKRASLQQQKRSVVDGRIDKLESNRAAAIRYRAKKLKEKESLFTELEFFANKNAATRASIDDLQAQINCIKSVLVDALIKKKINATH